MDLTSGTYMKKRPYKWMLQMVHIWKGGLIVVINGTNGTNEKKTS